MIPGMTFQQSLQSVKAFWFDLARFPWRGTALTLRDRFREVLQLEPVLEVLTGLEWVGQLAEDDAGESRYILLAEPDKTLLGPQQQQLLLDKTDSTLPLWTAAQLPDLKLRQVL